MSVVDVSKERGIIIRGLVKGKPIYAILSAGDYVRHRLIFPIVLIEDIKVNFKKGKAVVLKANSAIVVKCSKLCYVSVGDTIKVSGKIIRIKTELWNTTYKFIKANEMFNETQQTGILMY